MSVEHLTIRLVRSEDILDIYAMVCELENFNFDRVVFKSIYQKNISSDTNIYLIAIVDSVAIGFLSCHGQYLLHHEGMVYEIHEMYVDQSFRSRGVGKALLLELKRMLVRKNCKSLEVTSNMNRAKAHQFYIENGFSHTHFKFTH
jgi:PhnO protein